MEEISFKEVLDVCTRFVVSNGENMEELNDLFQKLVIKSYMKMDYKVLCLTRTFMDADKDLEIPAPFFVAAFDIALLFDCLLSYANIDTGSITQEEKNYENYDILNESGLADYILSFCANDYRKLESMAERVISYENLISLMDSLNNFDSEALEKLTDKYDDFMKNTDPQLIHDMSTILMANDDTVANVVGAMIEESVDKAKDSPKQSK